MIICSSKSEETSHIVSKLLQQKRDYNTFQKDEDLLKYIRRLLKRNNKDLSYELRCLLYDRKLDPDE